MGVQGIHEMINGAKDSPIDIYYGIPSSVPSTNEDLETTGGVIGFDEMKHLMQEDGVVCVGEVMNYRQIVKGTEMEITKFLRYLREEDPQAVIEGHCPSLVGLGSCEIPLSGDRRRPYRALPGRDPAAVRQWNVCGNPGKNAEA